MTQVPPPLPGGHLERLPPQAVDVEQAVLGAMMLNDEGCERGLQDLRREQFYSVPHGIIYDAMAQLYDRNIRIDQLTLTEELRRAGRLEEVGGVVYIAELAMQVATAANITHHAAIVSNKAVCRSVIEAGAAMSERAFAESDADTGVLLEWAESKVSSISQAGSKTQFETIEAVMHGTFAAIERVHNSDGSATGVETGFADLTHITSGWQDGDLIILAARPSIGKTALALCLAMNAAMSGTPVGVFSLEMSKDQLAQRMLCIGTGVNLHTLRAGRLRDEQWLQLTQGVGAIVQLPIHIDDTAGIGMVEVKAKTRQLVRQHKVGMIVVDYLQLMSGDRSGNREQEVSSIGRGLKGMAKDLGIPVVALSQISRASEARKGRRPMLSDLRESGSLEQDADVVSFIHRKDKDDDGKTSDPSTVEIILAKQRSGPTGSVELLWDPTSARFLSLAPEFQYGGARDWERD